MGVVGVKFKREEGGAKGERGQGEGGNGEGEHTQGRMLRAALRVAAGRSIGQADGQDTKALRAREQRQPQLEAAILTTLLLR